jgi:hypothetical protein
MKKREKKKWRSGWWGRIRHRDELCRINEFAPNRLCVENDGFRKFIQDVKIDFESKRIHQSEYDKIEGSIELYIQKQIFKKKSR